MCKKGSDWSNNGVVYALGGDDVLGLVSILDLERGEGGKVSMISVSMEQC